MLLLFFSKLYMINSSLIRRPKLPYKMLLSIVFTNSFWIYSLKMVAVQNQETRLSLRIHLAMLITSSKIVQKNFVLKKIMVRLWSFLLINYLLVLTRCQGSKSRRQSVQDNSNLKSLRTNSKLYFREVFQSKSRKNQKKKRRMIVCMTKQNIINLCQPPHLSISMLMTIRKLQPRDPQVKTSEHF